MPFEEGNQLGQETRFQPGQSGNPAGYPAGVPNRSTILKRLLAQRFTFTDPSTKEEVEGTVEEAMTWGIIQKATSGDTQAYKEIIDSVYGKQTDKLEVSAPKKTIIRIGAPESTDAGE